MIITLTHNGNVIYAIYNCLFFIGKIGDYICYTVIFTNVKGGWGMKETVFWRHNFNIIANDISNISDETITFMIIIMFFVNVNGLAY